jgi:putative chitinase
MLLKVGSKGEEVKQLQTKLGLTSDGSFGPGTEKAVKEWQTKNGLTADGIIGDKSWAKMFGTTEEIKEVVTETLNVERLRGHIPDLVIDQIPETAKKFNITTNLRLAHFLSQCHQESGNFKAVLENLNYSSDRLKVIFGKYFPGTLSESYAKQPEKIGSRVYGGRLGNGDENTKEGYTFRGRGYIQLTGKVNYASFTKFIGEDCVSNPDLVANKYPLASAAFFFNSNKLWTICDQGSTDEIVTKVTKRVNGGTHGLTERIGHFKKYHNLLK